MQTTGEVKILRTSFMNGRQVGDVLYGAGLRRGRGPDEGELRGSLLEQHEGPTGGRARAGHAATVPHFLEEAMEWAASAGHE